MWRVLRSTVQHSNAAYAELSAERDKYKHERQELRRDKTQLEEQVKQVSPHRRRDTSRTASHLVKRLKCELS